MQWYLRCLCLFDYCHKYQDADIYKTAMEVYSPFIAGQTDGWEFVD